MYDCIVFMDPNPSYHQGIKSRTVNSDCSCAQLDEHISGDRENVCTVSMISNIEALNINISVVEHVSLAMLLT